MDRVPTIRQLVDQNLGTDTLQGKFDWGSLTEDEFNRLLILAQELVNDPKGYDLLQVLFNISKGKNLWHVLGVLSLVILRPTTTMEVKNTALDSYRKNLDMLSKVLKDSAQKRNYEVYLGDYDYLAGMVSEDEGNVKEALQWFSQALKKYKGSGQSNRVEMVNRQIATLREMQKRNETPLPLPVMVNNRSHLQVEIQSLENQIRKQNEQLKEKQQTLQDLNQLVAQRRESIKQLDLELNKKQSLAQQVEQPEVRDNDRIRELEQKNKMLQQGNEELKRQVEEYQGKKVLPPWAVVVP